MGQALSILDSGVLAQNEPISVVDTNEPLDKLLLNKRFRHSFMEFADSCLAGESVHFFDEVHELSKIPEDDSVRRIYMARHIIEKYIASGPVCYSESAGWKGKIREFPCKKPVCLAHLPLSNIPTFVNLPSSTRKCFPSEIGGNVEIFPGEAINGMKKPL